MIREPGHRQALTTTRMENPPMAAVTVPNTAPATAPVRVPVLRSVNCTCMFAPWRVVARLRYAKLV